MAIQSCGSNIPNRNQGWRMGFLNAEVKWLEKCFRQGCYEIISKTHACVCVIKSLRSRPTLCELTRLLCPWDSPGKNTGVGCHALLQGIFLTQYELTRPLASPALAGRFFTTWTAWEAHQDSCRGAMGIMWCPDWKTLLPKPSTGVDTPL